MSGLELGKAAVAGAMPGTKFGFTDIPQKYFDTLVKKSVFDEHDEHFERLFV